MSNAWYNQQVESAFLVYQTWWAVSLHFNTNYDYFKYGGKTKGTLETFKSSTNVGPAIKINSWIKQKDLDMVRVAYSVHKDGKLWIGTPVSRISVSYNEWNDLYGSIDKIKLLAEDGNNYTTEQILELALRKKLDMDACAILLLKKEDKIDVDLFAENTYNKLIKMKPFYNYFLGVG